MTHDFKKTYQMIAFDMDGTLLNSQKELLPSSLAAIEKAGQAGKTVILSTGRCPAELAEYLDKIPKLRYLDCISGALVYDLWEKQTISSTWIPVEIVKQLFELSHDEDIMIQLLDERSIIQQNCFERLDRYHMSQYRPLYARAAEKWKDLEAQYLAAPFPIAKMNLYHTDRDARVRTERRIREAGLPLELAYAEYSSLECSAMGVDKGIGLERLCEKLHIPIEQTIAVGDGENDLSILKKAGLAVAMGNAAEKVLAAADVVVSDCDHDGCAEAIERWLL